MTDLATIRKIYRRGVATRKYPEIKFAIKKHRQEPRWKFCAFGSCAYYKRCFHPSECAAEIGKDIVS